MPLTAPYEPAELTDADRAFPAHALDWMPAEEDIPDEWYRDGHWANRLWSARFYNGLEMLRLDPVDGVDAEKAWNHLEAISRSFSPRHQHKMAALGYLTSLWFQGATWKSSAVRLGLTEIPTKYDGGGTLAELPD